jgi:hypothetical protein
MTDFLEISHMNGFDSGQVSNVKKKFMDSIDEGGVCPVCNRYARRYRRSMNSTMAKSLQWLCRQGIPGEYIDVPNTAPSWLIRSNQLPTLRWWGLVERLASKDAKRKHSGMWRATEDGRRFANNESTVPKYAVTYGGECQGFEGEHISIPQTENIDFDYQEMMNKLNGT